MVAREVVLRVTTGEDSEFVQVVEVLSRTMTGLALDGHETALAAVTLCVGCEDCTPDDEDGVLDG